MMKLLSCTKFTDGPYQFQNIVSVYCLQLILNYLFRIEMIQSIKINEKVVRATRFLQTVIVAFQQTFKYLQGDCVPAVSREVWPYPLEIRKKICIFLIEQESPPNGNETKCTNGILCNNIYTIKIIIFINLFRPTGPFLATNLIIIFIRLIGAFFFFKVLF